MGGRRGAARGAPRRRRLWGAPAPTRTSARRSRRAGCDGQAGEPASPRPGREASNKQASQQASKEAGRRAGRRAPHFFLSMSGISLLSARSTITCSRHKGDESPRGTLNGRGRRRSGRRRRVSARAPQPPPPPPNQSPRCRCPSTTHRHAVRVLLANARRLCRALLCEARGRCGALGGCLPLGNAQARTLPLASTAPHGHARGRGRSARPDRPRARRPGAAAAGLGPAL